MKVVFVGSARYSQPLDETSVKKFRALKALGDLFVIGFSQDVYLRRFAEHAQFYLLPMLRLPVLRYAEIFTVGSCLALWCIFRHGVRVLVAQSPYEGFAAAVVKTIASCFGHKVMLVVESHGDFEQSVFLQRRILVPGLYRILMCHIARFVFKNADCLRAISQCTRQQLESWAPGKPIVQFPAWTDHETFLQVGINAKPGPAWIILFAGVLVPLKGVHHLINAVADIAQEFPQVHLVIVGHEENRTYAAVLKEHVIRLGLDGRILFIGKVSQQDLATWMQKACVVVLPSLSEGLGRVLLEAMATATPVIGSHVGGIPDVVQHGITGFLVPPGDETALAERLRWVLEEPDKAYQMGCRGRAFATAFFSTETYIRRYKQLLETAAGSLLSG